MIYIGFLLNVGLVHNRYCDIVLMLVHYSCTVVTTYTVLNT